MQVKQLEGDIEGVAAQLGIQPTDTLFFASDLKRLALIARKKRKTLDVNAFIDSFLKQVPQGNLIIPAYTDYLKSGDTFDLHVSKPCTGALSNKVFRRKDFKRTSDPLHSVFIQGVDQEEVLALQDESTFGEQSVFAFMDRKKGKMLFIDIELNESFTYLHYLEEKWKVFYRRYFKRKLFVVKDGKRVPRTVLFYTKKAGYLANIEHFERQLKEEGIIELFEYEGIPLILLEFEKLNTYAKSYMDKGGKFYLFDWKFFFRAKLEEWLGKR